MKIFLIENGEKTEIKEILKYPDVKGKTSITDDAYIVVLKTVEGKMISEFSEENLFTEKDGKLIGFCIQA